MSYAGYAHRGAYPLVVAALLAGVFVLATTRPGGAGEKSPRVKWLVMIWLGQNIMLVGSSLFRLALYVDAYALTYWRVAAFIWMVLVVAGLLLIVVRFLTGQSTGWLISANVLTLVGALYVTSLVNIPGLIMSYNLKHALSQTVRFPTIDHTYLEFLGAAAYPAFVRTYKTRESLSLSVSSKKYLDIVGANLLSQVKSEASQNWRAWGFRSQRSYWELDSVLGYKKILKRESWEGFTP